MQHTCTCFHATSDHCHFCNICWSTEWKSLGCLWSQSGARSRNALLMHGPKWCLLASLVTCWWMSALATVTQYEAVWCEVEPWDAWVHERFVSLGCFVEWISGLQTSGAKSSRRNCKTHHQHVLFSCHLFQQRAVTTCACLLIYLDKTLLSACFLPGKRMRRQAVASF